MKQCTFILVLIALFISACANVQTATPFDMAYAQWKSELKMSPFSTREESEILSAVAQGDCAYANFAIFEIGRVHLPGAIDYTDEQVIDYGVTVDQLVEACRTLKTQTIARR